MKLHSITALIAPFMLSSALFMAPEGDDSGGPDPEQAAVGEIVAEFSRTIAEKDWDAFDELFLDQDTPWIGVVSAKMRARAKAGGMLDEHGLFRSSRASFQSQIDADPMKSEETFDNLIIDVADGLASVKADYDFLADGRVLNHGIETWNLVATEHGWKIVSVLYSMHPGPR